MQSSAKRENRPSTSPVAKTVDKNMADVHAGRDQHTSKRSKKSGKNKTEKSDGKVWKQGKELASLKLDDPKYVSSAPDDTEFCEVRCNKGRRNKFNRPSEPSYNYHQMDSKPTEMNKETRHYNLRSEDERKRDVRNSESQKITKNKDHSTQPSKQSNKVSFTVQDRQPTTSDVDECSFSKEDKKKQGENPHHPTNIVYEDRDKKITVNKERYYYNSSKKHKQPWQNIKQIDSPETQSSMKFKNSKTSASGEYKDQQKDTNYQANPPTRDKQRKPWNVKASYSGEMYNSVKHKDSAISAVKEANITSEAYHDAGRSTPVCNQTKKYNDKLENVGREANWKAGSSEMQDSMSAISTLSESDIYKQDKDWQDGNIDLQINSEHNSGYWWHNTETTKNKQYYSQPLETYQTESSSYSEETGKYSRGTEYVRKEIDSLNIHDVTDSFTRQDQSKGSNNKSTYDNDRKTKTRYTKESQWKDTSNNNKSTYDDCKTKSRGNEESQWKVTANKNKFTYDDENTKSRDNEKSYWKGTSNNDKSTHDDWKSESSHRQETQYKGANNESTYDKDCKTKSRDFEQSQNKSTSNKSKSTYDKWKTEPRDSEEFQWKGTSNKDKSTYGDCKTQSRHRHETQYKGANNNNESTYDKDWKTKSGDSEESQWKGTSIKDKSTYDDWRTESKHRHETQYKGSDNSNESSCDKDWETKSRHFVESKNKSTNNKNKSSYEDWKAKSKDGEESQYDNYPEKEPYYSEKSGWHKRKYRSLPLPETESKTYGTDKFKGIKNKDSKRLSGSYIRKGHISKTESDPEYKEWEFLVNSKTNMKFTKISEEKKDLFDVSKEYSLAHCVAEDFNMGSGIAVEFRKRFKSVGELLAQNQKTGGLAILQRCSQFIYYLVTKKKSVGKPTYQSLWKSLTELRKHIKENDVKKLAMPMIGCGLDRLDWPDVKVMIEHCFRNVDIEILVCYIDSSMSPSAKINNSKVVRNEKSIEEIDDYTLILYLASEDGHVSEEMVKLDEKFKFLEMFRSAEKRLGEVIRFDKHKPEVYLLYGLIVRKKSTDPIDFISFEKCVQTVNKQNKKDEYEFVAIQEVRDEYDIVLNDKILNILKNNLKQVEIHVCGSTEKDNWN